MLPSSSHTSSLSGITRPTYPAPAPADRENTPPFLSDALLNSHPDTNEWKQAYEELVCRLSKSDSVETGSVFWQEMSNARIENGAFRLLERALDDAAVLRNWNEWASQSTDPTEKKTEACEKMKAWLLSPDRSMYLLDISQLGLKTLPGAWPADMTGLDLSQNGVTDIGALKWLKNLEVLDFSDNHVQDISVLKWLTNLEGLNFRDNQVCDISELRWFMNLKALDCSSNEISSISALTGMPVLSELKFGKSEVNDISILEMLTTLKTLDFTDTLVSDISALEKLTNLETLGFSDNHVSDISVLEKLTYLEALFFDGNPVNDISALAKLTNLDVLSFDGYPVDDTSVSP